MKCVAPPVLTLAPHPLPPHLRILSLWKVKKGGEGVGTRKSRPAPLL